MPQNSTYSFLDVQASITGPGGAFSLGSGAGNAEEGISVAMVDDKNTMTIGADGSPMHNLHASKAATISVKLLKTSPVNQKLSQMYALQTTSSGLHGQNVITISNPALGDAITAVYCAFKKLPDNINAKDGGMMDWVFDAGIVDTTLGGGLLAALALSATNI